MKHTILATFLAGAFCLAATNAQHTNYDGSSTAVPTASGLRKAKNNAWKEGEVVEYRVHYGFVDAGTARIEVKKTDKKIAGRELYHIVGSGVSRGAFDWFFKVRDYYESYVDKEGVFPWLFIRRVEEGGYFINQDYVFYQNKRMVKTQKDQTHEVPLGVQDMLSAFYYARTFDISGIKKGDLITVQTFVDDELWPLQVKYIGTETIEVDAGTFDCLKFVPIVQKGRIFKKEEDLVVYITNDENKIPVLAKANILVGSIKMEMTGYEGLANPVSKVKD